MVYTEVLNYLGAPLTCEEIEALDLPKSTILRLRNLLKASVERQLDAREQAQLEAFREAAFYLRMGAQKTA